MKAEKLVPYYAFYHDDIAFDLAEFEETYSFPVVLVIRHGDGLLIVAENTEYSYGS